MSKTIKKLGFFDKLLTPACSYYDALRVIEIKDIEISTTKNLLEKLDNNFDILKATHNKLKESLVGKEKASNGTGVIITDIKENLNDLVSDFKYKKFDSSMSILDFINKINNILKDDSKFMSDVINEKDKEITALENKLATKNNEIKTLEDKLATKNEEIKTLNDDIKNIGKKLQDRVIKLEKENAELKANKILKDDKENKFKLKQNKKMFTCKQIFDIINMSNNGENALVISKKYGVAKSTITRIIKKETYKECHKRNKKTHDGEDL